MVCVRMCKYVAECGHMCMHICMHKVRGVHYTYSLKMLESVFVNPFPLISAAHRSLFLDSLYH